MANERELLGTTTSLLRRLNKVRGILIPCLTTCTKFVCIARLCDEQAQLRTNLGCLPSLGLYFAITRDVSALRSKRRV
jgi:hypothetical protein